MSTTDTELLNLISEIENDPNVKLKVPDKLVNPDALVIAAKHALTLRNEDTQWNLRSEGVLSNFGSLSIRVAPKNVGRALRLFDTIIKVFRARGHQFIDSDVDIQGQKYTISIREKVKRIEGGYRKIPTNILAIKVHCGYPVMEYYDAKTVLIEEKIARIVARLELDVKDLLETWARNDLRRAEEERGEKIRIEYLTRQEKELNDFKLLLSYAHRKLETKTIRDYIQSTEDNARQTGIMTADLENWIAWARNKADWHDPHIEKDDELLKKVDRMTLKFASNE